MLVDGPERPLGRDHTCRLEVELPEALEVTRALFVEPDV